MLATFKYRKKIHIALFIFVVFIQLLIFKLWYDQNSTEKELTESYQKTIRQNLIFNYSTEVTKNYFDAQNFFMEYLHDYNREPLLKYQNSLTKMTAYLDSLNSLIVIDKGFSKNIRFKKEKERQIIKLRKELDSLIKERINPLTENGQRNFNLRNYDYLKVLNSIEYDTIQSSDTLAAQGFWKRIGKAVRGNYDVKKEMMKISMKMSYGTVEKVGSPEEQMKNIFEITRKYYQKEFGTLRNTYSNLRETDIELMAINKKILRNSQDIILHYNSGVQELNRSQFEDALENLKSKRNLIIILISVMGVCTVLLLVYAVYSYIYEENLALAKNVAEKNLDFKNRIIGMLSHEMRSPLNIISNITSKMKSSNENSNSEDVTLLNFTSNSLQITVNQILDFFKNENGKLVLYNSKVNLKNETSAILQSLKSLAEAKKIGFISNIDDSMRKEVWADNGKIHQLFYNIIGNALKFTSSGSITVDCGFTEVESKIRFDVRIKDTGVGIPQEDLDKVFDKFYQSKNFKEQISFGAGLGLNLCKEIVTLYNGEIAVDSILNQGTEIHFYLLLDKAEDTQHTSKTKLINGFSEQKIKVVAVDDDLMIIAILKKMLSDVNFAVATFTSEKTAKDYLENEEADLLITDLQIANISGIEFIRDVKALKNKNSQIPIIAITGDSSLSPADLPTIQAQEILIKPIDKEELYTKLLHILEDKIK